ncbi:MAG: 1-acyl-sn-glycerol-3-phosphate acyltransferase [Planctomycetota bacterium]|jgi:1-acyl-sn-glycerol-3-phosphate acyltransferase
MNRRPLEVDGRRWDDRISPAWIALVRPFRRWVQRRTVRLARVEVRGAERLRQLVEGGAGVLLTPNHSSHADCFTAMELADAAGLAFHIMVAADVFATSPPPIQWVMQRHGCFSIDRHGTDLRAFKRAMEILLKSPHPLLVFAEGEVYHLNDYVTPFRVGPAMMALTAAKRSKRPIHCVPCAFKYYYTRDPTPELERVMTRLEERVNWRPAPEMPLVDRILRYGNGQIALKEVEHLGLPQPGTRRERLGRLRERMLGRLETRLGLEGKGADTPERVKAVRQVCMDRLGKDGLSADERREIFVCLDETFVVIQAYSYLGDYLDDGPPIERVAETLDKFEEDWLGLLEARVRGEREAVVAIGEPVEAREYLGGSPIAAGSRLTDELERRVQSILDELASERRPAPDRAPEEAALAPA